MGWKPKTIAGKILKGVGIAAVGVGAIATGVGAVGGVISGVGAAAGAAKGIGKVASFLKGAGKGVKKVVIDKVGAGAANLVTGKTKEQRQILKDVKKQARDQVQKKSFMDQLIKAGSDPVAAAQKAGIGVEPDNEATDQEPGAVTLSSLAPGVDNKKLLIYGGIAAAALLVFTMLNKKR